MFWRVFGANRPTSPGIAGAVKKFQSVSFAWWQRLVFVPCGVNFHLEHHFMASVPCYKLRELRELLRSRHALDGVPEFRGYGALLRHVVVA